MASWFRKISPAWARLETLALRRLAGAAFAAGGGAWRIDPAAAGNGFAVTVYGKLGEADWTFWLDEAGWLAVVGAVLETPPGMLPAFPEPLLRAAFAEFADAALSALEKAIGLPIALVRIDQGKTDAPAAACRLSLVNGAGLRAACAWTVSPEGGPVWTALERTLAAAPGKARDLPGDLPLEGVVSIRLPSLSVEELADLAPGDIVLSPAGSDRSLTVGRRLRFAVFSKQGILSAEGKTMAATSPVPKSDSAGGTAKAPSAPEPVSVVVTLDGGAAKAPSVPKPVAIESGAIGGVEIELQAQVGRLTVTLDQLARLGVGQVVEFAQPVESPVALVAGGRPLAVGELVEVGGRVGMRITAMSDQRNEKIP